ncbi:MAG: transglycosylase SLT domain-containing protein [Candidatus Tectomicrobia bacterium]|uniref:Transglycosylase SLT domain-containing protein n=1 Tax=Tectimicrobiota bacterium TaxID=2528274 RepID=A0A932FXL2_UNCTE|nr:transglycosylase SLT domain-containing protein [Candidatus Tectomicrobia bacterium]
MYEVVNLREIFGENGASESTKLQLIEQIKEIYRNILYQMADGRLDPSSLSAREYRVHQLFQGIQDREILIRAAESIRSQPGQKNRFLQGLLISGRYNDTLKEIFRNHGLPEDLIALPHIESNFNYRAYSSKGAAGAWQFIRSTGQQFLRINEDVDERLDPLFAGQAAARLLKQNYEVLGSWPLAITAYNHGRQGMFNAVRETGSSNLAEIIASYRGPNFGFASKNFYAEFLAAREVIKNYRQYFGEMDLPSTLEYDLVQIPRPVKIARILGYFGLSREDLKSYNPALRSSVLEARNPVPAGFLLRLPKGKGADFSAFLALAPEGRVTKVRGKAQWYRVKRGDTLLAVARQFDTDLRTLRVLNGLKRSGGIQVGQRLRLPASGGVQNEGPRVIPAKYVEEEEELASSNSRNGKGDRKLAKDKKGRKAVGISAKSRKRGKGPKLLKDRSSQSKGSSSSIKKVRTDENEKSQRLRKGSLKKKKASTPKGKGLPLKKPSRRDL